MISQHPAVASHLPKLTIGPSSGQRAITLVGSSAGP